MEHIFKELIEFEKKNVVSLDIDDQNLLTHLFNTPQYDVVLDGPTRRDENEALYVVPRNGDLLLHIDVNGLDLEDVCIFQYDEWGCHRIVYDHGTAMSPSNHVRLAPFPTSGFPLMQCGKSFYIAIKQKESTVNASITCRFTWLDGVSRKRLAAAVDTEYHGVKILHRDGTLYQVFNVQDHGHSPNVLAPVAI